jgi:heme-degrading monooxygenase HmoA
MTIFVNLEGILQIMIERHWKGIARTGEAENYIIHLQTRTFPHLLELAGFIEAKILKRPVDKGVEFLIVTVWDSLASIKQFAGERVEVANVPQEAREMMAEHDLYARHYEVAGGVEAGDCK